MSTGLHPRSQVEALPLPAQAVLGHIPRIDPSPSVVTPSKRSDDDIQFISSKPVKRRKISEQKPKDPSPKEPILPPVPLPPVTPASSSANDYREAERRVSTGMVGLPSDIHAMELTCALRGVSLPVLENFVLDQPLRRPRPVSPPELSPKQLPQTISPAILNIHPTQAGTQVLELEATTTHTTRCLPPSETPAKQEVFPNSPTTTSDANQLHVLNRPISQTTWSPTSGSTEYPKATNTKSTAMPPPPFPRPEASPTPESNVHDACRPNASKQPCQMCARLRQQANVTRAQGLPVINSSMPQHHLLPHMPYHQPYGQHLHPHMMAMATNHMHPYGPSFTPFMMPVHGNTFAALPSQFNTSAQQGGHQNLDSSLQPVSEKANDTTRPVTPPPNNVAAKSGKTSSPVKPPASLIQPTYRKHSPNLIVDVAETCQEKFPFEEVAKRHNIPVEKVFDVFAAIIQVPLLRCPTDRRRAGRVATARVKEYTRAKKDIQESRAQGNNSPGKKQEFAAGPSDVAQRLGPVDFPEGFHLGG
ncbi:hypothetical protein F5X99DRAFT_373960 [Biscogniauxia marginata]|nr:hypothetical protein F5X99DRAFT_373960 [Biscogniauxia marginata]